MLEKFFKLKENNTTIQTELIAGFTTFITMAYIIFVNPQMMSTAGMDQGASFVGTCIAASIACILMGLYANWPIGLAPGMGLNAFFTYTVVGEMGYTWEIALGAVFIAGILFWFMSITPVRQWMLESIPLNLRVAMGAGVGLFIGLIGLKNGGIIVPNEATLLSMGNILLPETILAMLGFLVIAILAIRKVRGAILIGVMLITLLSIFMGIINFQGLVSYPPSFLPIFLKLDILGALDLAMISIITSFLFVNLFDTAGTLLGVANQARLVQDSGKILNLDKALKADSSSSAIGAFLGCAPVTSYIESSAGAEAGGRTGLTAVTVGFLFLIAIFFSPLASIIPAHATAGALIYVAILMLGGMEKLNWSDATELLPALIIIVMIPLTFSIANGIALGFLSYVVLKIATGKVTLISSGAWFLTVVFLSKFMFL
ncbi:permease family protein [SAR86 cluster bacterium SAR86E]|uniref:Permease family protein n=1 Tax=SAR86 cluster bacterium SAR86E TaxID=1208365 RepID=K6GGF8_9GAMM|nr:permease family protein [SAR86 cluster bacterium SAR86E]